MAFKQRVPLPVPEGGTGNTSLTDHGVLIGSGTSSLNVLSPGTDGQVLIGGTGVDPAFSTLTSTGGTITFTTGPNSLNLEAGGTMAAPIMTTFTSSGTWNKGSNSSKVVIICWNGGCGGGSGRRGADGAAGGGGGGSPGAIFYWSGPATLFGSSESVTVGTGGAGGAAQTSDSTDGNDGQAGTISRVGNIGLENLGSNIVGQGGINGTTALLGSPQFLFFLNLVPGGYRSQNFAFSAGTLTAGEQGDDLGSLNWASRGFLQEEQPTRAVQIYGSPGGGGGGADSGTERAGGRGGNIQIMAGGPVALSGGAGGVESGTINGSTGNDFTVTGGLLFGGSGGGGGGGQSTGGSAGNGGNGGIPGAGGGGGGGSLNGTNSGAGGAGGDGLVIIIEYQ